ncbi:hypothetical protein QCD71_25110, partial [Sphingomonas sp. PsM26]|nr:hypothetical protein [Sphingomonas sp. PsM26]
MEPQVKQAQLDKDLTDMAAAAPKADGPMVVMPISEPPKQEVKPDGNMAARFAEMSPNVPIPE